MNSLISPNQLVRPLAATLFAAGGLLTLAGCSRASEEQVNIAECRSNLAQELHQNNQGLIPDPDTLTRMCLDMVSSSTTVPENP